MVILIILAVVGVVSLQFIFKQFASRQKTQLANNYHIVRRIQHVLTGAMILILIEVLNYKVAILASTSGAFLIGLVTLIRFQDVNFNKMFIKNFEHLLRPHELYGFPGAFYFISGVALCLFLFSKDIATLGIMLVSVGDPSAAIIGIFFDNSKKIWSYKNYAGTIGSAIIFTIMSLMYSSLTGNQILEQYGMMMASMILFIVGVIVELIPLGQPINKYLRLDDNLFSMIIGCVTLNILM